MNTEERTTFIQVKRSSLLQDNIGHSELEQETVTRSRLYGYY
jgi:hypothetical protein